MTDDQGSVSGWSDEQLLRELDDFFCDLVGTYNDCRAQGLTHFQSAIGAPFEGSVRRFAALLNERAPPPSSQTRVEEHRSRDEVKTLKVTQELNPDGEVKPL